MGPDDSTRRHVWGFLENLSISPWHCVELLDECDADLYSTDHGLRDEKDARCMIASLLAELETTARDAADDRTSTTWLHQLEELRTNLHADIRAWQRTHKRILGAAHDLTSHFAVKSSNSTANAIVLRRAGA